MNLPIEKLREFEFFALQARQKCLRDSEYEINQKEKFCIAFLSGIPYRTEYSFDIGHVNITLDECSVIWNDETSEFMVYQGRP